MPRPRRSYSPEYRVEASHRVIDSGRPVREIARELDVHENLLHKWVREERRRMAAAGGSRRPDSAGSQSLSADERAECPADPCRGETFTAGAAAPGSGGENPCPPPGLERHLRLAPHHRRPAGQGSSLGEIATKTGIPKTSLHRYLNPYPAGAIRCGSRGYSQISEAARCANRDNELPSRVGQQTIQWQVLRRVANVPPTSNMPEVQSVSSG